MSPVPVPVIINNRNRLTWPRQMIVDIRRFGGEPIILDNASTYAPLLDWYASAPCEVIRLDSNVGHMAPWITGQAVFQAVKRGLISYVVTDPDLDLSLLPNDTIQFLKHGYDLFPWTNKSAVGLRIDNLPDHYPKKEWIIGIEQGYWNTPLSHGFFNAPTDTTFAYYEINPRGANFYSAVRAGPPYAAEHKPWYANPATITDEERYYVAHSNIGVHSNIG